MVSQTSAQHTVHLEKLASMVKLAITDSQTLSAPRTKENETLLRLVQTLHTALDLLHQLLRGHLGKVECGWHDGSFLV